MDEIPVRRAEASAYCRDDAARDAKVGLEDVRRRTDRTPPWALPPVGEPLFRCAIRRQVNAALPHP